MKLSIRPVIWCSVLGSLMGAASAAPPESPPQRVVSFSDLDVTHAAGAAVLYSRIKYAALQVCGSADTRDLRAAQCVHRCQLQAIANAVNHINLPELTKYVSKGNDATLMARQP
jgi:UrcA family protein